MRLALREDASQKKSIGRLSAVDCASPSSSWMSARALPGVGAAELHAADVAAVRLDLQRVVLGRPVVAADADVAVPAIRAEELAAAPAGRPYRGSSF